MLLATSVDHDRAPVVGVRVNVLLSRYLIEPCGSGKSKLTYMCRIDLRYGLLLLSHQSLMEAVLWGRGKQVVTYNIN